MINNSNNSLLMCAASINKNTAPSIKSQQGIALITIMLIVAIATVIAAGLVSRIHFQIQRTIQQHNQAQAYQFALGGEQLIRQVLYLDGKKTSYDNLSESWSKLKPEYKFDQGLLIIKVKDLHGRLNINNLVNSEGKQNEIVFEQFTQLFNQLSLDITLLKTLVDWLDPNSIPTTINSEDNGYLSLDRPYRAANANIVHLSELTLLQGWEHDTVTKVAPFVTALPSQTKVNINTAPAEVLAALVNDYDISDAKELVTSRGPEGFDEIDKFITDKSLAGRKINTSQMSIQSEYFAVYIESKFADSTIRLQSLLHRNPATGQIQFISRDRNSRYLWPVDQ